MLEVKGKVFIGEYQGDNMVLDCGIERLLAGERLWDIIQECSIGSGSRETRSYHEGLEEPLGITVPVIKEEFFDNELQSFIIRVKARFQGELSGVREFAWGDSKGCWNRLPLTKLQGHRGRIDTGADEYLDVTLELSVGMTKVEYPVEVLFDGVALQGKIEPVGLGNKLAWSAEGIGSNRGLGYWGTAVGLASEGEGAPLVAQAHGRLEEYKEGDYCRTMKLELGAEEGNLPEGIKYIYFGTSHEGSKNVGWLWRLVFLETFEKSKSAKLWLEFTWSVLRG